jgi:two-component system response regulator AtoC
MANLDGKHMNLGVTDGGVMNWQEAGREEHRFPLPRLVEPIPSLPITGALPGTRRIGPALPVTSRDQLVDRVAQSRVSVLITGETGAGKEVLARRIHQSSPRADKPMISINCAAVCGSLIESELFGHQRGAFTGADQSKVGLIEAADGGTLFLDEIGELSLAAQAKLLRVIETRVVVRVGGVSPKLIDVRFIAATNCDLDSAVEHGSFRDDLLFRLEGIRLMVLPLRARVDEILPAARQFLEEFAKRDGLKLAVLSEDAERALLRHTWKGNFRELRNVIERAALICSGGVIEADDLLLPDARQFTPARASGSPDGDDAIERDRIVSALSVCAGNQTRAASLLGMSRRTFVTRLEALAVPRPRARRLRSLPA